jgi:asparagine synthase (glutamine-hydrolysing)
MYADAVGYMADDILAKVDRAAMGVSLETRVPLLDHRVIEFAWRLPMSMKVRDGETKWLLKQVLYKYVPKPLVDRPKAGFAAPIDAWLRGELRDWAEDLLSPGRLADGGYFAIEPIRERWREHLAGEARMGTSLWHVLSFQSWLAATRHADAQVPCSAPSCAGSPPAEDASFVHAASRPSR